MLVVVIDFVVPRLTETLHKLQIARKSLFGPIAKRFQKAELSLSLIVNAPETYKVTMQ